MGQALDDIKVIDLTWYISGPYCTKLLADYGAEVIKIEKPGEGDPARRFPPFLNDVPHPETSGLFLHLNTNKKSITLNLKSEEGKKIFLRLVQGADLVVENFSPGVMGRLGLEYLSLEKVNPRLVMVSISNFGQTGPYREFKASELVLNAMATAMKSCGSKEREPLKMGGRVVQYQAGAMAAVAAMVGILASKMQEIGQYIDVAISETQLGSIDRRGPLLVASQYTGEVEGRIEAGGSQWGACPDGVYPCKAGYCDLIGGAMWWPSIFKMMGEPEALADPRYGSWEWQTDPERKAEILAVFLPWAKERTKEEVAEAASKARQAAAPIYTTANLLTNPHLAARGYFVKAEHPVAGKLKYPGPSCWPEETPWELRRAAPLLGEHNEQIYSQLGYSKQEIGLLRAYGAI